MSRPIDAPTVRPMKFGLSQDLRAAASQLSSATLHEASQKIGALPSAIKPLDPRMKCVGPALTVHSPPGDNLWLHRALDVAQPGDVMVVFASGAYEYGYWGEIMSTMAMARGMAGLVIDGCVRDASILPKVGFPVFATMIILGSWWASIAWSRYWGWDPKETSALATWLVYAVYLHARSQRGWQGRPAALLLVIGFGAVLLTYSGNLWFSGLHTYSGL